MAQQHKVPREVARAITEEIGEATKAILAKHGLAITKSSSGYGDSYKFTISASTIRLGKNKVNLDRPDAQEFIMRAGQFGLTTDQAEQLLGTVVYTSERTGDCVLVGYNGRKAKLPVMVWSLRDNTEYFIADRNWSALVVA